MVPTGAADRARAVRGQQGFQVMARRGADELPGFLGEYLGDRSRILPLERLAGQDDGSAIHVGPTQAGLLVGVPDEGLEIVGISMDDGDQEQVAAFGKEFNVNYTIVMGNHAVGDAYGGARFLPQTFLVNREGRIIKSIVGIKSRNDFEESIKLLLDAK